MRVVRALIAGALVAVALVPTGSRPASADGTPDISLDKTMPNRTLYGATTPVTLTASNASATDGYNLSFNDVLPPGVTFVPGDPAPTRTLTDPAGNTVIIWENVADLQAGTTVSVSYEFLATSPDFVVGDSVFNGAGAYVNTDPRLVPDFDPLDGTATGDFTGFATAGSSTDLVPFLLDKAEPSTESELLRGVHDHKAVYTLTVANNLVNATTGFRIEDYLPAGIEFLGCGGVDNSTPGTEEYPGAGRIDATADPALTNCIAPSTVETVTVDPDAAGPLPSGVYTHVVWTALDLGAQADLAASAVLALDYLAAIPLRENTEFPPATDTTGIQAANLDNNTGPLTRDEQGQQNYATATGTYTGDGLGYDDDASEGVTAEDVSIHKSVDTGQIEQTGVSRWTLLVETGEYATSTSNIVVTDVLPDGLCPVAPGTPCDGAGSAPAPLPDVVTENPDGTWTIVWNLPDLPAPNSTATVEFSSVAEDVYDGGSPVSANDSWQNVVTLTSTSAVITDNDGSTTALGIPDDSAAGQSAGGISILKEVSVPAATLTCGDGTGVTFAPDVSGDYRPGDRVCWRLTINFPSLLDTLEVEITDFLPAGFTFESQQFGANHDATGFTFDAAATVPTWRASGVDIGGLTFETVLSSTITDPGIAGDGDILANLMKVTYENTAGSVFQLRDQADATWVEPQLSLAKGVIEVDNVPVPGAPADGVQVQDASLVTYQIAVTNTGSVAATATSVRDQLPPGIGCGDVSAISGGGSCSLPDGWIQWDGQTVAAASTLALTYDVTIPAGTAAGARFDNVAGVRTFQTDTNTGTPFVYVPGSNIDPTLTANTDPAGDGSSVLVAAPTIDKSRTTSVSEGGNAGSNEATIGETISYTVAVTIPEGSTVYGPAELADLVSARTTYVPASATATLNGAPLPAGFSLSDAGNSVSVVFPAAYTNAPGSGDDVLDVSFDVTIDDEAANSRAGSAIPNTATFTWDDLAGNSATVSDTVSTRVVEPNLDAAKANDDGDGLVDPGQTVGYTVTVENTAGTRVGTAHDLLVVDVLPAEITPLEAANDPAEDGDLIPPSGGVWDADTRTITWTAASLAPGGSLALSYGAVADDPLIGASELTNTATVIGSSMAGVVAGERDAASPNGGPGSGYQASAASTLSSPQLSVAKSVSPASATVGEAVQYTVDVLIPAGVILYDVTVIDDLPAGVVFDTTSSTSCDEGGGPCSPDPTIATIGSNGDVVAWFLGDLSTPASGDRVVTVVYDAFLDDVPAVSGGAVLTNTVGAYGNQADTIVGIPATPPDPASFDVASPTDDAAVSVEEPALTIDKDVAGQLGDDDSRRAVPGDVLTFTLTVENTGSSAAYDVAVTDTPDDRLSPVSILDGPGYVVADGDPSDGTLGWHIAGPIAPASSVTITYALGVPASFDESQEVAGPELVNTADVPHYYAVAPAAQDPGRTYRDYDNVVLDSVAVELDLASLGDRLWFDVDGDGVQDPGEPGLDGIDLTVRYHGPDGTAGTADDEVFPATTGVGGAYLVEDLPGGSYTVTVDAATLPAGMTPSYDLDGGTATPNGAWVGVVGEDEAKRNVDFGYIGTGAIGDTIWLDRNGDGVADPGEPGLSGVTLAVTWLGFDGTVGGGDDIAYSTITAADGSYLVDDLPAGEYTVSVAAATLPGGVTQVFDPDATLDGGTAVTLASGESHLDADFGYRGDGSIGDLVWLDLDGDGVTDGGESGIAGVVLELTWFGPDGTAGGGDDAVFQTTTAASGAYTFDGLPEGEYQVDVTGGLPAFVANSFDEDGDLDSSAPVSLAAGADHRTADFGYAGGTMIGDRVWWDLDRDGVQDPAEPGLGGVEVTVTYAGGDDTFGTADDLSFVAVTDVAGDYVVSGLPGGDFRVQVTDGVAAGLAPTYDEDDGTVSPDGTTAVPGLGAEAHLTADFGYAGDASLGDYVWLDVDGDGLQDPGESGLPGVTVHLTWYGPDGAAGGGDDVTLSTVTDGAGGYRFDALPAGTFAVTVDASTLPQGVAATFDVDGSADGTTEVVLGAAEVRDDVDFGFAGAGQIGDTVWWDRDGDGTFGPDEVGLAGVDVTLVWAGDDGVLGTGDDQTFTDTTDAAGNYGFGGLPPGIYTVTADVTDLPPGMGSTFDEDGGLDSTTTVTLADGEAHLTTDFGYRGTAAIGDTVYLDVDGNGVQDVAEPGVAGQAVELVWAGEDGMFGTADDETFGTRTDAAGSYLYDGLPAGDFTVSVVGGITSAADNSDDPDGGGDSTSAVSLTPGERRLDEDFGYVGTNSLGDTVWWDADGDGVVDADEGGLATVDLVVTWFGPDGVAGGGDDVILPTATTDDLGSYGLSGLPDGAYAVRVTDGLPPGFVPSFDEDDGTATPDGITVVDGLAGGTAHLTADFGYRGAGSIGDSIWLDLDGNGTQDPGEPGIAGVEVRVTWAGPDGDLGTTDDVTFDRRTDGAGRYLVAGLPPGDYAVAIQDLPAGVAPTFDPDGGADDAAVLSLADGADELDQDFGYSGSATVGDLVWIDVDGNGRPDPGEPGVAGVTVTITSPGVDGVPGTGDDLVIVTETDADGGYLVPGLPPGPTTVEIDAASLPAGLEPRADRDGGDPTMTSVVLNSGEEVLDVDFPLAGSASLEGIVWEDTNADGMIAPTEPGIPGVTVVVIWDGPLGPVQIDVVTGVDGTWVIDRLPPGDYTATVDQTTIPDGLVPSTPPSVGVTVPAGGSGAVEHGMTPAVSIGSLVWIDADRDGVQDAAEPGIAGVTVTLFDEDGNLVAGTVTDERGAYLFDDLPPGTYTVVVDPDSVPEGLIPVFDRDGTLDFETTVSVLAGTVVIDANFGFFDGATLPTTGADLGRLAWLGVWLLLGGSLLIAFHRRGPAAG